jgi:hypothetical protein
MPRARQTSPASRKRAAAAQRAAKARRAKIVWGALLGSMTVVGGFLLLLDNKPAPRVGGLSMAPLVAAGTPSNIEGVLRTTTPLDHDAWTGIVIHHSGSLFGSPASIEAEHRARNFRGLGHHFIIGNGSGLQDGEIHFGYRWSDQLPGAHAGGPDGQYHNLHSISICLVGDGNRRSFTSMQTKRLVELVATLCRELRIPADKVVLHSAIAPTDDPGRYFPEAQFRQALAKALKQ